MNTERKQRTNATNNRREKPLLLFDDKSGAGTGTPCSFTDAGRALLHGSAIKAVRILSQRDENKRMQYIQCCIREILTAAAQHQEPQIEPPTHKTAPIHEQWTFTPEELTAMQRTRATVFPLNAGYTAGGLCTLAEALQQLATGDAFSVQIINDELTTRAET